MIMIMARMIFITSGTKKPNRFMTRLVTGGKYRKERSKYIIPGRGCTKNIFSRPIVSKVVPNIQAIICRIEDSACIEFDLFFKTILY